MSFLVRLTDGLRGSRSWEALAGKLGMRRRRLAAGEVLTDPAHPTNPDGTADEPPSLRAIAGYVA